jgi:Eco57I restriction-modification methylase
VLQSDLQEQKREHQARNDVLFKDDKCKPRCCTSSLAQEIVGQIKPNRHARRSARSLGRHGGLEGAVAVFSDTMLLEAIIAERYRQGITTGSVTFIAHTESVAQHAREDGVNVILVPYEKLDLFFSCTGEYNYLKDMKFDVIVGNPPFNPPKKNGGAPEGTKIWQKFIEWAFAHVDDGGHLLFVTPNVWRMSNFLNGLARDAQALICGSLQHYEPIKEFVDCGWWHCVKGTKANFFTGFPTLQQFMLLPNNKAAMPVFEQFFSASNVASFPFFAGHNPRKIDPTGKTRSRKREYNDLICDASQGDDNHPYRMVYTTKNAEIDVWDWCTFVPHWYQDVTVTVTLTLDARPFFTLKPYGSWGSVNTYKVADAGTDETRATFVGQNLVSFFSCPLVKFICKQTKDVLGRQLGKASSTAFPAHLFRSIPLVVGDYVWTADKWEQSAKKAFNLADEHIEVIKHALP